MKKSLPKRLLAFMLIMAMITTTTEWTQIFIVKRNIYAAEEKQTENKEKKEVIQSENTKTSTTFQLGNGKKETVFYGQDVRFETDNGTLKDYDPTLVKVEDSKSENGNSLKDYAYENETGDKKHYLPKKLTDKTPVLMENGKYEISFAPVYGQDEEKKETTDTDNTTDSKDQTDNQTSKAVEQAVAQADQAVRAVTEATSDDQTADTEATDKDDQEDALTSVKKLTRTGLEEEKVEDAQGNTEEKQVKVSYESEKKDCTFSYESLNTGVKESIVLTKAPEGNVLKFHFKAKGLTPKKNAMDGGISFLDEETDEIVASLEAPNINDATGNAYSEKLYYDIEPDGEEDSYLLTLHLDEDYFQDKDREYPVTIDPTVSWTGSTNFWDVYVINGSYKNTNFYDSGITAMMAGKAKQGVYRTYLRFKDFTKKIEGKYVDSATLTMYETGSSQSGQTIEARRVTGGWTRSGLKWSNRPGYSTNYGSVKTTGKAKKGRSINLTQYARECASGKITSYGVMLKNSDETKSYGQFYGSRASANRPKLSVTYYDGPTKATKLDSIPYYVKKGNKEKITWEGITSKSLKQVEYKIEHYDYATAKTTGLVQDYKSTGSNAANGSVLIDTTNLSEGAYRVSIRGVDNGGIIGGAMYKGFIVDGAAPKINSVSIDQGNGAGTSEDQPSSVTTPQLTWNVTEAYLSKIEYQVGNGAKVQAGTAVKGSVKIPSSYFKDSGSYPINLYATDKAGNVTKKTVTYHYIDEAQAAQYEPVDVSVRKTYGKAVISWKQEKETLPGSIYYEVHKGDREDFTPSQSTLVRSALKETWCADTKAGEGKEVYYKVRAVKLARTGKILESTPAQSAGKIRQDKKSEYSQYLGEKEYRDSAALSTPGGSGTIEKSKGNLTYKVQDFQAGQGAGGFLLERTYNSESDKTGMFGNGWYDTFHKQLYQVGEDLVFQDSDGTYITFQKDGDAYKSSETKEYTLKLSNVQNGGFEETSPNKSSVNLLSVGGTDRETYYPTHNVKTTSESGETEIKEDKAVKTIDVACTITDKDRNSYKFDANGFLIQEEDANENFFLYEYDKEGRLSKVTTSQNQTLEMNYGKNDLLKSIGLFDGTKMVYTYDEDGNLIKTEHVSEDGTQSEGGSYIYDENGWMTGIVDGMNNTYQITYKENKAVRFTKPDGEYQQITYGDGTTTVSLHKSDGTKISEDSMTYEKNSGKLLSSTNENGIKTTYQYDNAENPLLQTGTETKVCYQTLENNKVNFKNDVKVTTTTAYDSNENVVKEVDETGQVTTTKYYEKQEKGKEEAGNPGNLENIPKNEVVKNSKGEIISDTAYEYDEDGNTTEEYEDIGDTRTEYAYDEDGEIKEEQSYENVKSEGDAGVLTSEQITKKEEADHKVSEVLTSTEGKVTQKDMTSYDAMGREVSSTDQNTGEVTTITYDFMGRAVKTEKSLTDQEGKDTVQTETKSYNANGSVTSETSSAGVTTEYRYDSRNRVIIAKEDADDATKTTETSYGYETAVIHTLTGTKIYKDLQVQTTKVNGTVIDKTWTDHAGNSVRTLSSGIYTDHVFTEDGKEIAAVTLGSSTDGEGKISLTLYNKEGKTTHTISQPVIDGESITTGKDTIINETAYDVNGNESAVTDGNGNVTTYTYDDQNHVTGVSRKNGNETISNSISYDMGTDGKTTTSVKDANGHVNKEVTNEAGLTESTTDLGDGEEQITTAYSYDTNGNKIRETYADGGYKTFDYDRKNRLIKTESYEAGEAGESIGEKTLKTVYSYDINDRLLESIDYQIDGAEETAVRYTEYQYDRRGQTTGYAELSQENAPTADEIKDHQIRYHYDSDGKLTKVTYPTTKNGVHALAYEYDQNGWLTKIKGEVQSGDSSTEKTVRSYTYDSYGKVKEIKDHRDLLNSSDQAVKKVYTYDSLDRVKEMIYTDLETGKVMESYSYSYDKNSNITEKTEVNNYPKEEKDKVNETKAYTYDALGRLTKTVTTDHKNDDKTKTVTYTYDKAGNRTKEDDGITQTAYTYNGLDQLQTATKEKGTAVDEVRQYSYDANGNQTDVKNTKTGQTESYTYDAENRLSKVSVTDKDGKTAVIQQNRYNGDGQRIQKVEGSKTTNYYYQDGVVSYTTDGDNIQTSQNLIGTDENILATQRYGSDNTSYYLYNKDIQGSTTSLVKEDGSADATYRYTDFGETTINGENKAENEVCYTGGIYDQSTGLYYLNARYYNPEDGGFLTEDTYRGETNEPDTQNLYAYCADNPVNYVDPSGHKRINTRRWEMIDATYWYDTKDARCYGRRGEVHYAKSRYNKSLKKYKSLIRKENKKALFAQKMFGQTALYTIADYGIGKFLGLIAKKKVSKIIPKYILDKIKGKVKSGVLKKIGRIVGGGILANARKGVTALKDCKVYHNAIKKEYSKIK